MITIIFFSRYREQMGLSSLQVEVNTVSKVTDVIAWLQHRYPLQTDFLNDQQLLIAVNQEMATAQTLLKRGDEVAFFPPVTGG